MTDVSFDKVISKLGKYQNFDKYILTGCVFHTDSKPSMLVFRDGWFRCLGCGRNGHINSLWDKLSGRNIVVTPEKSTEYRPPYSSNLEEFCYQAHIDLMQFSSFQWYIEKRGLENRIETNEIGYSLGWYSFPVRDEEGQFKTAVLRAAPHVQEVTGLRYWCKSVPMPYVPDWYLLKASPCIFVVFGIMDALSLSSIRYPVMTSTAGLTLKSEWFEAYRVPIYIIPDQGEEAYAYKLCNELGWRGKVLKLNFPVGKKDVNGFLEEGKRNELISQLSSFYDKRS